MLPNDSCWRRMLKATKGRKMFPPLPATATATATESLSSTLASSYINFIWSFIIIYVFINSQNAL